MENSQRPVIFNYVDYRKFLGDFLDFLQIKNPKFSASALVRKAGLGENSRGYFGLILKGKRNLSSSTLIGFAKVLNLSEKEFYYFENLVHYNQAETEKEKILYFQRIEKSLKGKTSPAFELLKSQYNYFTQWYLVAIRELVSLDDFIEDPDYIIKKLRNKVTTKEVAIAINDLLSLGLLKRDQANRLIQSEEFLNFTDHTLNYTVVNRLHSQLIERSKESIHEDDYQNRSASCVVLATDAKNFELIREEIRHFREHILSKYGASKKTNSVLNLSIQLNHLTQINEGKSS